MPDTHTETQSQFEDPAGPAICVPTIPPVVRECQRLQDENENLQAEVKRLRVAGNNLAAEFCNWCPHEVRGSFLRAWDAAISAGKDSQ